MQARRGKIYKLAIEKLEKYTDLRCEQNEVPEPLATGPVSYTHLKTSIFERANVKVQCLAKCRFSGKLLIV